MRISTVLDNIDSGDIALPEFQRGYVWNRDQVRGVFDSLYKRHPVGGLLVWVTEARTADRRGDGPVSAGSVTLLLDGQQRMTSLYGVVRGKAPKFFDGNADSFTGLRFHLEDETFAFHQPIKMRDDPLWIDVTALMVSGQDGHEALITSLAENPDIGTAALKYSARIARLLGILDIDLHVEQVTGAEKSLDVVVDIFNRVNSGGTKLSQGDLALAKICAAWPDARNRMKAKLKDWSEAGYDFNLDWLLRSVNTVLTGEARFIHLHNKDAPDIEDGLERACRQIDTCLNQIAGRLGLDHDRVLFGRYAVPVMVRYLDRRTGPMGAAESDKMLFWYAQAAMWGRFSGSTESFIDQDLETLEGPEGGLDGLIERLRLWHGGLRVEAGHFEGSSIGARFYPVLYMLTRMGAARDWGNGALPLKANMHGKMARLEVHHIFPKSRLYDLDHDRWEVNALANFCFLTKATNLEIGNRFPEEYFEEVETNYPGALASQWIPMDTALWRMDRYLDFLEARKALLAAETNRCFAELLHEEPEWFAEPGLEKREDAPVALGGISSEAEERELVALNEWLTEQKLPRGQLAFDHADEATGAQRAVFDLAWPEGLQPGLTGPVAVLLNETAEVLAIANAAGYRCFTSGAAFRRYVENEILNLQAA